MKIDRQRLRSEATRIHLRYCVEIVEELNICPWARQARLEGRVEIVVSFEDTPSLASTLALIDALEARPELEIGLLAFPLTRLPRLQFAHFVSELRLADATRRPPGTTVFAMADFHPDAALDTSSPERLVPYVRRSPDPAIQLVHTGALARVRLSEDQGTSFVDAQHLSLETLLSAKAKAPPLSARVALNNLKTLDQLGAAHVRAAIEDIHEDRARSYAALGVPAAPWSQPAS